MDEIRFQRQLGKLVRYRDLQRFRDGLSEQDRSRLNSLTVNGRLEFEEGCLAWARTGRAGKLRGHPCRDMFERALGR